MGAEAQNLDRNPLDLIERNLILPPVVELGRPRALVVGDMLRGFKRAVVLQVRGDAGCPEGMVPILVLMPVSRVRRWIMR